MRSRKPIDALTEDEQRRLVNAFRALIASGDTTGNYTYWASVHASCGQHHSALFLPWHRAFIFAFEDALRQAGGDDSVTLPYWNWIAVPRLPDLLGDPVFDAERYSDAERLANHLKLPTQDMVDGAMALELFAYFGGYTCTSGGGELESVHGYPHSWTGPWMAKKEYAAFDPIFWFHHSNVDRLWALWQIDHPAQQPPCLTQDLKGVPRGWRVADVLAVSSPRLAYEYVHGVQVIATDHSRITRGDGLRIRFRVPREGRVELRLDGVHTLEEGPGPAEVLVFFNGFDQPARRLSLFGVTQGWIPRSTPEILDIAECPAEDHARHKTSFRIDLTGVAAHARGETAEVRVVAAGGPPDGVPVVVSAISVAAVVA